MSLVDAKRALRGESGERRRALSRAAGAGAAERAAEHFLANVPLGDSAIVSGYWPIRAELDARPLMSRLHELGHACALPVMMSKGAALGFRAWRPGMALETNAHGVSEPRTEEAALTPEVMLVPLLAFDREGYRLGYGGGYYDRSLAGLRGAGRALLAVGYGFAGQEVERVPRAPGDQRLDWVVSEREARKIA